MSKRGINRYMGELEYEDDPADPFQSSGEEWDFEKAKREENGRRKSTRLTSTRSPRKKLSDSDDFLDEDKQRKRRKNGVTRKRKPKEERQNSVGTTGSESDISPIKPEEHGSIANEPVAIVNTSVKTLEVRPEPDPEVEIIDLDKIDDKNDVTPQPNSKVKVTSVPLTYSRPISRKYIPKTIYSEEFATGSFVIAKDDAQIGDPRKHPCIWRIDGKALLQKYEAFDENGKVRHRNTSVYTGWSSVDKDKYSPITVDVINNVNSNFVVEIHWDKLQYITIDSD